MSISKWEIISTGRLLHLSYPIPGSEIVVKSRSVKRNAKNALVLGRAFFPAATAPFPKSRTSYFRSARFTDVTTILSESLVQATTKRLTSTTWGLPPPCKQAPNYLLYISISVGVVIQRLITSADVFWNTRNAILFPEMRLYCISLCLSLQFAFCFFLAKIMVKKKTRVSTIQFKSSC